MILSYTQTLNVCCVFTYNYLDRQIVIPMISNFDMGGALCLLSTRNHGKCIIWQGPSKQTKCRYV